MALYFMYYNFIRIHKTLRMMLAMAPGVTDHLWSMGELAQMIDETLPKPGRRGS